MLSVTCHSWCCILILFAGWFAYDTPTAARMRPVASARWVLVRSITVDPPAASRRVRPRTSWTRSSSMSGCLSCVVSVRTIAPSARAPGVYTRRVPVAVGYYSIPPITRAATSTRTGVSTSADTRGIRRRSVVPCHGLFVGRSVPTDRSPEFTALPGGYAPIILHSIQQRDPQNAMCELYSGVCADYPNIIADRYYEAV